MEDYSCLLQLDDISYNDDQQTKYIVMQLLERNDGKKWFVWSKQGKLGNEHFQQRNKDFFNKYEAMLEFETVFLAKTQNKWSERAYFKQKPGLYMLIRKDNEKEVVTKFTDLEKEILNLINEGLKKS